jgi:hypothetical protein
MSEQQVDAVIEAVNAYFEMAEGPPNDAPFG